MKIKKDNEKAIFVVRKNGGLADDIEKYPDGELYCFQGY